MNSKDFKKRSIQVRFSTGDSKVFIDTLKELKNANISPQQVFMPAYVQEIKEICPIKKTKIPIYGLIGGIIGAVCGLLFQYWVNVIAYPLNFGGKPLFALPSFVPVMFECAVLCAAIFMVIAFLSKTLHINTIEINELISKDEYIILLTDELDVFPQKVNKYLLNGEMNIIKIGC